MVFRIKVASKDPSSKLLIHLHNRTRRSISEIKSKCKNFNPIYECDSADTEGLKFINSLTQEIEKLGYKAVLFIEDEEFDTQTFKNIEKRNIEIDEAY